MAAGDKQHRPSAGKAFAILASVFALLFGAVVALLAFDQYRVLAAAERLQHEAVPEIIRFQRLARNLDIFDFALTAAEVAAITALDTGAEPRADSDVIGH